jgi:PAS domain S-box-containing protein
MQRTQAAASRICVIGKYLGDRQMPNREPSEKESVGQIHQPRPQAAKFERVSRETTNRRRVDEELDKAWSEWEATFDAIQDSIMLLECEFNIVQANAASSRFFGKPLDEIVGKKCCRLVHGTEEPPEGCPLRKAASTKKRHKTELYVPEKDMWTVVSVDPILDEQGNMAGAVHIMRDITGRKKIEEALRESERHFRDIFENAVLGLYRTTPDGRILMANPALLHMLGYASFEDLAERNLEEEGFAPEYPRSTFKERIEADGQIVGLESAWTKRDGSKLFVHESTKAIRDGGGNTLYYEGTVEDITEHKKAEEALREGERRYRELFEHMTNGVFVYAAVDDGADFVIKEFNRAGELIDHIDRKHIIGKCVTEAFPGVKAFGLLKVLQRVYRTGKPEFFPDALYEDQRISGWRENWVYKLPTGEIVAIYNDITERKRAENALRKSEEHYRMLAETMNDGLSQIDENGKYVYVNKRLGEIFGYTTEEMIGRHWTEFFDPDAQEIIKEQLARRRKGFGEPYEAANTRRDGKRIHLRISPQPIFGTDGKFKGSLAVIADIADRKKAENRILRQAKVLEAINKVLREALTCDTHIEVAQTCLSVAEELTGSKFGFIGEINEAGLFDNIALSDPGWKTCRMPHSEATRSISNMQIRGIRSLTLREEKSQIVNDPASHPNRVEYPEGHPEITCFLGVPLKQMGKTIGMIGLANKQSGYNLEDLQAIETLSVVFVEALMRKRASQALLDYQGQLKTLTSELALAEEHERRRIAAGIHDDIAQKLAIAKLELQTLALSAADVKMSVDINSICTTIDRAIEDAHSLTFELSNPALYELSFDAAIEQWFFKQIQKKHGIKCRVVSYPESVELDADLKVLLFRAIRELAVNVVKYAKASTLRVNIKKGKDRIMISVRDDGVGFVPSEAGAFVLDDKGGFGLFNIRERLEHLGGAMKIQSASGKGTRVTLAAPLENKDRIK